MTITAYLGRIARAGVFLALIVPVLRGFPAAQTPPPVSFVARRDFLVGQSPCCVALSDFNGDKFTDLAVVNVQSNSVSILIGNGDGTFQPASDISFATTPSAIAVADFNGDGKADLALIVAGSSSASLSILLGNGDGTFQAAKSTTIPLGLAIVTGDFNGDGKTDVAVGGITNPVTEAGAVAVLLGNGDGTFQAPSTYATGSYPSFIATGDFNGDGKLDLVTANLADSSLSLLLGNGDGTFKTATNMAASDSPRWVAVADFNHDGKDDLAVATNRSILVYLGNGDGTFQSPSSLTGFFSVAVGDFNGDGNLDLAACGSDSESVVVLLGNGDGTFGSPTSFTTALDPGVVAAADFENDGKTDLLTVNNFANSVSILHGNGDGTFVDAPTTGPPGSSIVEGDFNGDGKADIAVSTGSAIAVLLGNGNGTFQNEVDYPVAGTGPGVILSSDFNGDGIVDLAAVDVGADDISVLLGKGDGTFQAAANYVVASSPAGMAVADFNGDGKPDIVVFKATADCRFESTGLTVLLGNGDGTFRAGIVTTIPTLCPLVAIGTGDFNRDGKTDVIATIGGGLYILFGNGDGTFQSPQIIASGTNLGAIGATGDFNGDGKLDFAVQATTAVGGSAVGVYLGNGDGTFTPGATYPVGFSPQTQFTAADVNGDSILDLVTANYNGDTVSVLIGNGDGTFQPAENFGTVQAPVGTAVADFNGDGKADVAAVTGLGVSLLLSGNGIIPKLGLGIATGSSASATVQAGGTASYQLTLGGMGFQGTATLACTGAPTGANCSAPTSVTVSSTSASNFTVSVSTTAGSAAETRPLRTPSPWLWAMALIGVALPAGRFGQRPARCRIAMLAAIVLLLLLPSCGSSGSSQKGSIGTPPGTYTLTVTVTSGSLTQPIPLTLVVQ